MHILKSPILSPRSSSSDSSVELSPPRSPSPPTQTFHPSLLPKPSGIIGSAAGGAHYSGAKVHHRRTDIQRASSGGNSLELSERRQRLIDDLKELYSCRPSPEILQNWWREDSMLESPLARAKGLTEVAAQWYSMPRVFSKASAHSSRILMSTSTPEPNRIIISQVQEYTLRFLGTKKTINSVILIDLDDEDKIIHLEDQWNGDEAPNSWGLGTLRRANGKITPWFVRLPKDIIKSS